MNDGRNGANAATLRPKKKILGLLEWFHVGDRQRVEDVLADAKELGINEIRTALSWADFVSRGGPEWYDWLLPRIREQATVLPCFTYTPPSEGIVSKVSAPPREPKKFADFIDVAITRYGEHFDWVELWNEPNGIQDWDWRLDPDWRVFSEMIVMASYWARQRGKKTVLGGMCPVDQNWLNLMCSRGVLENIDVVGIHGFPGTWEFDWTDWDENLRRVQEVLDRNNVKAGIWITEAGYSTWRHDEFTQLLQFKRLVEARVDRVYWYSVRDLKSNRAHQEGFRQDERHYHLGMKTADGHPKLLYRILEKDGMDGVRRLTEVTPSSLQQIYTTPMATCRENPAKAFSAASVGITHKDYVLITGGAGFVGTNLADRLLKEGRKVLIFDNLSRAGVEENLRWLCRQHPENLQVEIADVRDPFLLCEAAKGASQVFHFAAQVAVTTSLASPRADFEVNALGTLNLLEAIRHRKDPPPLVFTSTNKVYGTLDHLQLQSRGRRWEPANEEARCRGISEEIPLQFHSPYGCSKGAADQYVLDYAESFGVPSAVFRMSCIYGPHQCGNEDQGWVAHFAKRAIADEPITFYGDGRQVRDLLFVEDLVDAMQAAIDRIGRTAGHAFNMGGGPSNAVSLRQVVSVLAEITRRRPQIRCDEWRQGDQKYYVSDTRAFEQATDWRVRVSPQEGIQRLCQWLKQHASRAAEPTLAS